MLKPHFLKGDTSRFMATVTLPISVEAAEPGEVDYIEYNHADEDVDELIGVKARFTDNPLPQVSDLPGFVVTPDLVNMTGGRFRLRIEYVGTQELFAADGTYQTITGTGSAEGTITRRGVLSNDAYTG